ncbi:hypothetical protein JB92DRAFT_2828873 [Gautieria morchelliformis]|nr:hypothetical protein JB92DRAFT_2828873 [Gautieria morchelliformis]
MVTHTWTAFTTQKGWETNNQRTRQKIGIARLEFRRDHIIRECGPRVRGAPRKGDLKFIDHHERGMRPYITFEVLLLSETQGAGPGHHCIPRSVTLRPCKQHSDRTEYNIGQEHRIRESKGPRLQKSIQSVMGISDIKRRTEQRKKIVLARLDIAAVNLKVSRHRTLLEREQELKAQRAALEQRVTIGETVYSYIETFASEYCFRPRGVRRTTLPIGSSEFYKPLSDPPLVESRAKQVVKVSCLLEGTQGSSCGRSSGRGQVPGPGAQALSRVFTSAVGSTEPGFASSCTYAARLYIHETACGVGNKAGDVSPDEGPRNRKAVHKIFEPSSAGRRPTTLRGHAEQRGTLRTKQAHTLSSQK